MGGITGWTGYCGEPDENENLIQVMGGALHRYDNNPLHVVAGEHSAVCVAGQMDSQADCIQVNGVLAGIQGLYRWNDAGLASIAESQGEASALLAGYLDRGGNVLDSIQGCFSLVVVDENKNEVFIATDRTASEPLVYLKNGSTMVFASTADAMTAHPSVTADIDPQAVFNYLYFHVVPAPGSIYKNFHKLLPGGSAIFHKGGLTLSSYLEIDYQEDGGSSGFSELRDEFHSILKSSVKRFAKDEGVGTFLSGGTDSSTVTGMLSEVMKRSIPTFSIGFSEEGYDEMEYARIAARHFRTDHHEYYVTPEDIVDAVPKIAGMYGEPFGNSSAVPAYYCARLARENGITRMLAGDGGDELFAGNPHYARQYIFSIYDAVPEAVRKCVIEPLVTSGLYPDSIFPMNKFRRYVEQAMVPMPKRLQTYNVMDYLGINNVLEPDFTNQIDASGPDQLMSMHYNNTNASTMLNRVLWLDYKFILADNDLQKVSRMCALGGVEVAYPLLSEELVAFAARVPPELKLKGKKLRYFFKQALKEFLPPEIIAKKKHGFGLPIGQWIANHPRLGQFAMDNLSDLKSRHIVRPSLIDGLLKSRLEEHASFYGTMIWILLMLEQWFKKQNQR